MKDGADSAPFFLCRFQNCFSPSAGCWRPRALLPFPTATRTSSAIATVTRAEVACFLLSRVACDISDPSAIAAACRSPSPASESGARTDCGDIRRETPGIARPPAQHTAYAGRDDWLFAHRFASGLAGPTRGAWRPPLDSTSARRARSPQPGRSGRASQRGCTNHRNGARQRLALS